MGRSPKTLLTIQKKSGLGKNQRKNSIKGGVEEKNRCSSGGGVTTTRRQILDVRGNLIKRKQSMGGSKLYDCPKIKTCLSA